MKYDVVFYGCTAFVDAENEEDAIKKAKELYYAGELSCEIEEVRKIGGDENGE